MVEDFIGVGYCLDDVDSAFVKQHRLDEDEVEALMDELETLQADQGAAVLGDFIFLSPFRIQLYRTRKWRLHSLPPTSTGGWSR